MILTTTSRNPGIATRKVARRLSELVPYSLYTPRGVRNIEKLVALARKKGYRRICIVNEKKKKPAEMAFIIVDAKAWDWHSKVLKIKNVEIDKEYAKERIDEIKVEGADVDKKQIVEMFDIEEFADEDAEDVGVLKAAKDELVFYYNDVKIMCIKVI